MAFPSQSFKSRNILLTESSPSFSITEKGVYYVQLQRYTKGSETLVFVNIVRDNVSYRLIGRNTEYNPSPDLVNTIFLAVLDENITSISFGFVGNPNSSSQALYNIHYAGCL